MSTGVTLPTGRHYSNHATGAAYIRCCELEQHVSGEIDSGQLSEKTKKEKLRDLMHVRVAGYLIIHAPREEAREYMAASINACRDDSEIIELGKFHEQHFLRLFRRFCDYTPHQSEPDSELPSFSNLRELIQSKSIPAPRTQSEAKESALARDGFCCIVSGTMDAQTYIKYRNVFSEPKSFPSVDLTQCCHIIPEGVGRFSTKTVADKRARASNVWMILNNFGYHQIEEALGESKIHLLANISTLRGLLHEFFDTMYLWLEPTVGFAEFVHAHESRPFKSSNQSNDNEYQACVPPDIPEYADIIFEIHKVPRIVKFTTTESRLILPSREYLALHAACCKVAHMSGAAGFYDQLERDYDKYPFNFMSSETDSHLLD
ncbi:hypothetical protein NP233_g1109 [Leucocoprinus birnbaumii]|uniref:HNH nuclease domain-containing protein n=1 Tax=Leucocoprinus birnbaumii TaxID=56174 RepID=A0AAD5W1N4_9AGAR|nr:hypothetical protein NP233_g1109 [Leucocoprinus birnbaumii]